MCLRALFFTHFSKGLEDKYEADWDVFMIIKKINRDNLKRTHKDLKK